jgi:hypothetical protein|tara:strand:+ start:65 stop:463 length:399 start_codon:yes stop_codon:yes gene_type:complete
MYKKILLTSILILVFSSCTNEEIPITSGNTLSPPGWPVIFQGSAKVNGKDIPAGIQIFAKLGDHRSLIAETESGTYKNIVIGAEKNSDFGEFITFHIGSPDNKSVKSKEKYKMLKSSEPTTIRLDLNFPKLP